MDITLRLEEKVDGDYYAEVHVTGGRVHLRGVQSSGTYVAADITLEGWSAVKAFIDQQFADQPTTESMTGPPCNTEGDS